MGIVWFILSLFYSWIVVCEVYENHSYNMSIKQRLHYYTKKITACPYCDHRKLLPDINANI